MKKKALLILFTMIGLLPLHAADYPYLTFELTDGSKASISVSSDVTLTFSGSTLTIGSNEFTLTNLSKMYFSTSDETQDATGISETLADGLDGTAEIYDLRGNKVSQGQMHRGVYIIKTSKGTSKIVVK